ncbi:unnamed protein product [Amoebophrya sp. A120]|nr:unnamed protein product [Amoebophrya sp. A120]|eukprot:GSA120T00015305001.1
MMPPPGRELASGSERTLSSSAVASLAPGGRGSSRVLGYATVCAGYWYSEKDFLTYVAREKVVLDACGFLVAGIADELAKVSEGGQSQTLYKHSIRPRPPQSSAILSVLNSHQRGSYYRAQWYLVNEQHGHGVSLLAFSCVVNNLGDGSALKLNATETAEPEAEADDARQHLQKGVLPSSNEFYVRKKTRWGLRFSPFCTSKANTMHTRSLEARWTVPVSSRPLRQHLPTTTTITKRGTQGNTSTSDLFFFCVRMGLRRASYPTKQKKAIDRAKIVPLNESFAQVFVPELLEQDSLPTLSPQDSGEFLDELLEDVKNVPEWSLYDASLGRLLQESKLRTRSFYTPQQFVHFADAVFILGDMPFASTGYLRKFEAPASTDGEDQDILVKCFKYPGEKTQGSEHLPAVIVKRSTKVLTYKQGVAYACGRSTTFRQERLRFVLASVVIRESVGAWS